MQSRATMNVHKKSYGAVAGGRSAGKQLTVKGHVTREVRIRPGRNLEGVALHCDRSLEKERRIL